MALYIYAVIAVLFYFGIYVGLFWLVNYYMMKDMSEKEKEEYYKEVAKSINKNNQNPFL